MSVFHFFPVIFFMATMKHLLFGTEPQRWFNFYSQLLLTKNEIDLQQQIKYIHTFVLTSPVLNVSVIRRLICRLPLLHSARRQQPHWSDTRLEASLTCHDYFMTLSCSLNFNDFSLCGRGSSEPTGVTRD